MARVVHGRSGGSAGGVPVKNGFHAGQFPSTVRRRTAIVVGQIDHEHKRPRPDKAADAWLQEISRHRRRVHQLHAASSQSIIPACGSRVVNGYAATSGGFRQWVRS